MIKALIPLSVPLLSAVVLGDAIKVSEEYSEFNNGDSQKGSDYVLGAPQLPKITFRLPGGKTFTVLAKNLSKKNYKVKSVTLNGKPLDGFILKHAGVMAGGELAFQMGE